MNQASASAREVDKENAGATRGGRGASAALRIPLGARDPNTTPARAMEAAKPPQRAVTVLKVGGRDTPQVGSGAPRSRRSPLLRPTANSWGTLLATRPPASPTTHTTPLLQPRGSSWERDLDAYLKPQQGGSPPPACAVRAQAGDGVRAAPHSPDAWWALLAAEEAALGASEGGGSTATLERGGQTRGGVALFDLYRWAVKLVPRAEHYNSAAYLNIWLGYARQQWCAAGGGLARGGGSAGWGQPPQMHARTTPLLELCFGRPGPRRQRSQDDARDTLKTLKSQHIGQASAALYYEWAALEQLGGNAFKALGVLSKGLREKAQPAALLETMQVDLQAGRFVYSPPWAAAAQQQQAQAAAMAGEGGAPRPGHSAATTYAAFLTPGGVDERRALATPTVVSGREVWGSMWRRGPRTVACRS